MKLRYRLTLIVAALNILVIGAVSIILLNRARIMQTIVAHENMENISQAMANRVQQQFELTMDAEYPCQYFQRFQGNQPPGPAALL
jgi:sensor domain CHASE-containing protein